MIEFSKPLHRAGIQSIFWIAITVLLIWLPALNNANARIPTHWIVLLSVQLTLIWLNTYQLFPRIFMLKKYWLYFLLLGGAVIGITFFIVPMTPPPPRMESFRMQPNPLVRLGSVAFPLIIGITGSILFEIWEMAQQKIRENTLLSHEKLQTELKLLKSQINPHFLFNALNNIYSLSVFQSEKTPDSIARLSDILRYVIYDCEKDEVPLKKEVDYIRDYVELFQLKKEKGLNIKLDLPKNSNGLSVPPMLFIPFIENALKHSNIENRSSGWVDISLKTAIDHIDFKVKNSLPKEVISKDKKGGVGLENVRRRLKILFPEKHKLTIVSENDTFNVDLKLAI